VRHIFCRYTELKSVQGLKEDLDGAGIVSKVRVASDGSQYGSRPIARLESFRRRHIDTR
jgi:hypothetical protein